MRELLVFLHSMPRPHFCDIFLPIVHPYENNGIVASMFQILKVIWSMSISAIQLSIILDRIVTEDVCFLLLAFFILANEPALRLMVIGERNLLRSMEMPFLSHALLLRSDAYEEHGDVFFCGMPFTQL
jgi:hypothetical protein